MGVSGAWRMCGMSWLDIVSNLQWRWSNCLMSRAMHAMKTCAHSRFRSFGCQHKKSAVTESGVRLPDRQTQPWSHTERTKSSKRDSQVSVRCRGVSLGRTPLHRFQGPTVGLRFPSNGASPARCALPASTAAPSGAPRSACAPRGLAPAAMPAVQPDRNAR